MHLIACSRTIALGGIGLMAMLATGAPVYAQAMQGSNLPASSAPSANSSVSGFNPYDPQWALAAPFAFNTAPGGRPAGLHDEARFGNARPDFSVQ